MKIDAEKIISLVESIKPLFEDNKRASRVTEKGKADFVTEVDYAVQKRIKDGLLEQYPEIQFMAEEKDNSEIDFSGDVFILDPVDGTSNLIHDFQHSALSLGYVENGILTYGIVYKPYTNELWCAEKGKGAFLNGERIHVSSVESLERSLVLFGTSPYHHEYADKVFETAKKIFLDCSDVRRLGSAALDLAYVASGRAECYFELNLKPWDYAAGVLLVEESGGKVTDYAGNPIHLDRPCDIFAGNGRINGAVQQYLQ